MKACYPWQYKQAALLSQLIERQELPHAFLFYGLDGLGIDEFLLAFVAELKNAKPQLSEFENKPGCYWFRAQHKPFLIDDLRSLQETIIKKTGPAHSKLIVIERVDKLNIKVSNALLKVLEEPPSDTLFILTSLNLSTLLPTIVSRTFKLHFQEATKEECKEYLRANNFEQSWLDFAQGTPLLVKDWQRKDRGPLIQKLERLFRKTVDDNQSFFALKEHFDTLDLDESFKVLEHLVIKWLQLPEKETETAAAYATIKTYHHRFKVYDELLKQKKAHLQHYNISKDRLVESCFLSMDGY
jgi:DNA polymerase-3 subunit delta'